MARKLLACVPQRLGWLPSQLATHLITTAQPDMQLLHWATSVLHAPTYTCVVVNGHWLLLRLQTLGSMLVVDCWDGLQRHTSSEMMPGLNTVATQLGLRPFLIQHHCRVLQTLPMTCGAVALLHLGLELGCWQDPTPVAGSCSSTRLYMIDFSMTLWWLWGPEGLVKASNLRSFGLYPNTGFSDITLRFGHFSGLTPF